MPSFRIRWEHEDCPDRSWLEQWDTPEKYYGSVPKCSHGTPMKYTEDHLWLSDCYQCEESDKIESATFDGDESGAMVVDKERGLGERKHVPFDDYMTYWGNPERHVMLMALVEKECEHCGSWTVVGSLGNIDFMDDQPWETGTFSEDEAVKLRGYQGECSKELLDEARNEKLDPIANPVRT